MKSMPGHLPVAASELAEVCDLVDLEPGHEAEVVDVCAPGGLGERLMEMGLTPGTAVRLVRRGFFHDPLQFFVRGYLLSLRAQQARQVRVRRKRH